MEKRVEDRRAIPKAWWKEIRVGTSRFLAYVTNAFLDLMVMFVFPKTASKSFDRGHLALLPEVVISGQWEGLSYAEMPLMFFHRVIPQPAPSSVFTNNPKVGGQGIASGFRDASSLAWRLNLACRSASTFNHETLFEGWYSERKQQLEKSLAATIQNGNLCNEPSKIKAFIRNTYFSLIRLWPAWAHQLELGPRAEGMVKYSWTKGMPFLPLLGGGGCIPQVWSAPLAEGAGKGDIFTDDAIFRMGKKGLFQVVVLLDSIDDVEDAMMGLAGLDEVSSGEVLAEEATFIIHDTSLSDSAARHAIPRDMARNKGIVRIVSAEEAKVCNDSEKVPTWPEPLYYNCYRLQEEYAGKRYLIVRPDRFTFAACEGRDELMEAAGMIGKVLRDE